MQRDFDDSLQRSLIRRAAEAERRRMSLAPKTWVDVLMAVALALSVVAILLFLKFLIG